MSDQLRRLQAASVDGRAQNARFAQNQLKRLFEALVENKTPVTVALRNDTSYLPAEIEAEYYLTLETIRESYKSINNAKALENEYSIANNKDNSLRRTPVGCVYIVPARHTPLYATIAPLCAAIAAGNCVAIEVCVWE
jgi:acyl-CoA reductase-like NAD-dependent aldehyde dehydrogenase